MIGTMTNQIEVPKTCEWCEAILPTPKYPSWAKKYCNKNCSASAIGKKRSYLLPIICPSCGVEFQPKNHLTTFCNRSCRSKAISLKPENREAQRQRLLEIKNRPEVQEKLSKHLASENNPFRNPETQRKAHEVLSKTGYPMLNGGNGTGPTRPQVLLSEALGPNWIMEYVIGTAPTPMKYPTNYKVDLAYPSIWLAIEVHGQSHLVKSRQLQDKKKVEFLESRGWTVLTFWNNQILEDISGILKQVRETILQMDI